MSELSPHSRRLLLGVIAVITVVNSAAAAFSPYLLVEHPLLLVAGSSVNRHIALAAALVDPGPLFVVGAARRMLSVVVTYAVGYVYGATAMRWAKGRMRWLHAAAGWLQRVLDRFGPALLVPFSSYSLMLLAGATRMPLRRFLLAAGIGNLLHVGVVVWLGDLVSVWSLVVIDWLGDHLFESTAVCVALVVMQQAVSRIRRRRAGQLA